MAHATKCTAPEGNRGRDEWMTVIEMQEYMGASRSKAYDLIWSGCFRYAKSERIAE